MLSIPLQLRVFLCTQATDMRKSFDGLEALVRHVLQHDPLSGDLFVFLNRRRDRVTLRLGRRRGGRREGLFACGACRRLRRTRT